MAEPQELLITAQRAAQAGTSVLRGLWGQKLQITAKARFDFVTQADRASEEAVLAVIRSERPGDYILAEESAAKPPEQLGDEDILWVVDPLDGTTNFIHHIPQVAVSVAAMQGKSILAGVVIDVARGEMFSAALGGGAFADGAPLRVSQEDDPGRSLLLTGFPFKNKHRLDDYLALFKELFDQVAAIRRPGAAALDLAWLAAGRAEGFFELGLMPWDVAAGCLLIKQAGGLVSDFSGGDRFIWGQEMVAGNPHMHPRLQGACLRHLGHK